MFIGKVIFLALESKDFTNDYIRKPLHLELQSTGLITLSGKKLTMTLETRSDNAVHDRLSAVLGSCLSGVDDVGRHFQT